MSIRLNKFLADRGIASRRRSDQLIAEGRVSVNGRVVSEAGTKVEERDRVTVDGRPVGGRERHVYYVLNKPVGVITTLDDPQGRKTVRELLPRGARVYPVGRLDADTSGLLLLTNDGALAHRLMHPRYGVSKVYRVRLAREPRPDQLRRLSTGVRFDGDRVSAPAKARRIDPGFDAIMIELIVHEGRFRQVRRMCEAVGLEVTGLHRVGYGPIRLGPLARGMYRELSAEEVAKLRAESARAGGTSRGEGAPASRRARPGEERADEASDAESDETWIPGGGYLEPEPEPEWPARATQGRGDQAWRTEHGADPRPRAPRARAVERPRTPRARPAVRNGSRELPGSRRARPGEQPRSRRPARPSGPRRTRGERAARAEWRGQPRGRAGKPRNPSRRKPR